MNKEDYNELCLQDKQIINYIISSFKRADENYDEMEKYKNKWNELKKWLEEKIKDYRKREWFQAANDLKEILDKMQELEGNNDK